MKNDFTHSIWRNSKRELLLMVTLFVAFNGFASEGEKKTDGSNKKLLPPPTPTVTITPPSGANCYTVLTASGCNVGNTVYWYTDGGNYYSSTNPVTVSSNNAVYLKAQCYDSSTGFGAFSPLSKAIPLTYTEITPGTAQTLCAAVTAITLNASSATSGLTYQWRKNFSDISGATNSSYVANTTGLYELTATSGSCSSTSNQVSVSNATAPVISGSFVGTCGSKTLNLYVYNVGGGTFQWKLNGTNISGATAYTYSVPVGSATGSYTVEYNAGGCISVSAPFIPLPTLTLTPAISPTCSAKLTITGGSCSNFYIYKYNTTTTAWDYLVYSSSPYIFSPATTLEDYRASCDYPYCAEIASNIVTAIPTNYSTISPASGSICGTGSVLLTASSTFTGVTFQWQKNGANISGATGATYSATTAGNYGVIATTGSCNFTSGVSTVTVVTLPAPPVSITKNPNTSVNPGTSVILTASACPSGSTFKWEDNSTANPRTVTPSATLTYSVKCVSGTCESATSTSTTVTILPTITITSPTPTAICSTIGTNIPVTFTTTGAFTGASFTVTLTRTVSQCSQPQVTTLATATTATSPITLTLPFDVNPTSNATCNVVSYKIDVTNTATTGTINSNSYAVAVNPKPIITSSLIGSCGSQTATFITQTLPSGTFQWKKDGISIGSPNTGTSSSYSAGTVTGSYTVEYNDNLCITTSNAIIFAQNAAPTIALATSSCTNYLTATGCTGGIITWYANNGSSWVSQSTGTNYYFGSRGDYRATCTSNGCTSIPSNVVTGLPKNFAEVVASATSLCSVGGSVTLNASSATSGLTYQWQNFFSNITGATGATYSPTTGGSYSLYVTDGTCNFNSAAIIISTVTAPIISITSTTSNPATITNGQSLTLTANGCTSSGSTILWSPGGATTNTLVVSPSSNTNYTFTCTKTPCVITSNAFVVNVNPLLAPTITSSAISTCTGTSVTITGVCPSSSTISWNTSPVQTTSIITVNPSVTTSYVATCTLGSATSTGNVSIGVFDGTITSLSSGNWTDASTWSCNCIPASCNDVTVDTGHIVIIPASLTGKLKNLTVRGSVDMKNLSVMKVK